MASGRISHLIRLLKTSKVHDNQSVLYIDFDSHIATVKYERHDDFYDLIHTNIPDGLQGQGLGTVFAERIFDHLIENNKKMRLTCEFLYKVYSRNIDKYKDFVVDE